MKAFGCQPSAVDSRDRLFRDLEVGAGEPSRIDLIGSLPLRVNDQRSTNSCVGQALSVGIRLAHIVQHGRDPGILSARWAYRAALSVAGAEMVDMGCQPRHAIKAAQKGGVATEAAWPWDARDPLAHPGLMATRSARHLVGVRAYYAIAPGRSAPQEIRQALACGFPVMMARGVDEEYCQNRGPRLVATSGAVVGHHATLLYGYDSAGAFEQNSWGTDWRIRGRVSIAWNIIERASEFWVLHV